MSSRYLVLAGMNELPMRFLCSNLIKDETLASSLTFWLDSLHRFPASSSKVSLLSIFIPQSFSLHVLKTRKCCYKKRRIYEELYVLQKIKLSWNSKGVSKFVTSK